jgi:hypothetical protein
MKERQFYCVSCRKKVTLPEDVIGVKYYYNKHLQHKVPTLKGYCKKCDMNLTKFVKWNKADKMMEKYGKF